MADGEIQSRAFKHGPETFFGDLKVNISDAVFKGVNIGKTVLDKLETIPLIGSISTRDLTPEMRQSLTESDTNFKSIKGDLTLKNGSYLLNDIALSSNIFRAFGKGEILPNKTLNIQLLVALSPEISEIMSRRIREMHLLVNRAGEIEVPVKIAGTISNPRALPDISSLASRAARRTAEQAIGNILERALERHQPRPPEKMEPERQ